jgi:hypothetical protein
MRVVKSLDDTHKLYNSLVDHVSILTFRKNLNKYGESNRVRFLFKIPKVPLTCLECGYKGQNQIYPGQHIVIIFVMMMIYHLEILFFLQNL